MEIKNTYEKPDKVIMKELPVEGNAAVVLPKMSWNVIIMAQDRL